METLSNPIILIVVGLFILLFSSILHEIAHGYIAYRLGDPTAKILGRLTLNPISHIDPYMSILMPLMFFLATFSTGHPIIFGGAKPVPVDPFNLRDGQKDLALVSLAGPLTNIILAIIAAALIHLIFPHHPLSEITSSSFIGLFLGEVVQLNLLLAVFNLLPIPPLDGSKVFALLLPKREAAMYMAMGNFGMLILFFLLFFPIGGFSLMNFVYNIMNFILSLLGF